MCPCNEAAIWDNRGDAGQTSVPTAPPTPVKLTAVWSPQPQPNTYDSNDRVHDLQMRSRDASSKVRASLKHSEYIMKTFIVLFATSLLLVSACTTVYVPTRGGNVQDFEAAKTKCLNDPNVVNAMGMATTPFGAAGATLSFQACLREQGWVPQG
jgi:hypothetical protein